MNRKPDYNTIIKKATIDDLAQYDNLFDECTFQDCDFAYANLSDCRFIDCIFDNCNLSLAKLEHSTLQTVEFRNSKITGVNFTNCNSFLFSASFTGCNLDYTVWHKRKLNKTIFTECSLNEADFTEADMTQVVFGNCNLNSTVFNRTILKGADFRTAQNFTIDPEINTLTKAKFSLHSLGNLLGKYNLVIE